jgi:hypothetical protein
MKSWCINLDERFERWRYFSSDDELYKIADIERFPAIYNSNGSLGCISSHLEVMKLFDADDMNLIFEDDFERVDSISYISKALDQLPDDWHCLYLGAMLHEHLTRYSQNLFKLQSGWCNHGIIYNGRTVADEILKHSPDEIYSKWRNIDTWMAHEIQPRFNCFIIDPIIGIQRPTFSDIIRKIRDYDMISRYQSFTIPQN